MLLVSICLCAGLSATVHGGIFGSKKSKAAKDDDDSDLDSYGTKDTVPTIGQYTSVVGNNLIRLEGAGLVVGLDGTGEDPPPSLVREMVLTDMKRRGVSNPSKVLKSPNVAVVIVTAYLPPLIRENELFDIEVSLPAGSKVKSLNGGLSDGDLPGRARHRAGTGRPQGKRAGDGQGSILVPAGHDDPTWPACSAGKIVAGGKSKIDRDLALYLRTDFPQRSVTPSASRMPSATGSSSTTNRASKSRLAEAKTDQQVKLKVLSKYRDNYPRYLDVIRKIAFRESEVGRQVRLKRLHWELLDPKTTAAASLSLEAIGEPAIPTLKPGLKSKDPEVRFNAAVGVGVSRRQLGSGRAGRVGTKSIRVPHLCAGRHGEL